MNKLTLEPMQARTQHWKLRQNMVLSLFLNVWIHLTAEERNELPITVKLGERNHIVDREGNELCEYTMIESMPFAHWYRTFSDYELIDRIGREYGDTETVGDDDSSGDDGGVEDET